MIKLLQGKKRASDRAGACKGYGGMLGWERGYLVREFRELVVAS